MNQPIELLKNHLFELEQELFKLEIRKSAEKISKLLSDDFIEFTSSGSMYNYKKGDVFNNDTDASEIKWEIKEFKVK